MPVTTMYVARMDYGQSSGLIYSFDDIPTGDFEANGQLIRVHEKKVIQVQSPEGYVVENAHTLHAKSDTGFTRMMYDPEQSAQYGNGRIYLRAARVAELLHDYYGKFSRVG